MSKDYKYGIDLNVQEMATPASTDDGYIVSQEALEKFKFTPFPKSSFAINSDYPLNLYGNNAAFKPFPGDLVRGA
jgi:hypothetical protein